MSTGTEAADGPARFVVGIDLGTTNSAVGFVDTARPELRVETFLVPQLVAPGEIDARDTLPSFHYQAAQGEFPADALRLPWDKSAPDYCVGVFARDHGAASPGRLIASAKSWLCHAGVDRTAPLLPWHGAPDAERLSPVDASARILAHVRAAWNHRHPQAPLETQDVVLTLPASFDEVARELTVRAAKQAGLPRVWLLEEPQAAFYAWIQRQKEQWDRQVQSGQKILICDIGGGTSDFTLIRVRSAAGGRVQFHRVAVGPHLILGGDNLDLALAHHLEKRLSAGGELAPRQWAVLVRSCRKLKETLLGPDPPETYTLRLPGSGSKLVGGGLQAEVSREEAAQVLVEGFLPRVALDAKPEIRRAGLQEFGLPFAADPAISRYLAAFLTTHRHAGDEPTEAAPNHDPARPDLVLFNGGLFESTQLRERLQAVLGDWFTPAGQTERWHPVVLGNPRLDLAVAHGAAYYGLVRRGIGVKIAANLARSYYIGVETEGDAQAVCLVPGGAEEGQRIELARPQFQLRIREPVEFPLYVSSTRLTDRAGDAVPLDPEQLTPLPPIRTVLEAGRRSAGAETLPVTLFAGLTEIGTLDLGCREVGGAKSWKLQFDVRATTQTDRAAHAGAGERGGIVDEAALAAGRSVVAETFGKDAKAAIDGVMKRLEEAAGQRRADWPPTLLRGLWEALFEHEAGRRKSPQHEARWLQLLGYCLRPGYGLAVDDWRVGQTWRLFQASKLAFPAGASRIEGLILWRRIGGGLTAGQQQSLATPLLPAAAVSIGKRGASKGRGGVNAHETAELIRLLGSLELLPVPTKQNLGTGLLERVAREEVGALRDAVVWALGRLGARELLYGPLNSVVPAGTAETWLTLLQQLPVTPVLMLSIALVARLTGDRYRDVGGEARRSALKWLADVAAPSHHLRLVEAGGSLEAEEQAQAFGETLPRGLRITGDFS